MTKLFPALAVTLALAAGAASANTLGLNEVHGTGSLLELGTVVSDANGVVEVYDNWAGQQGALLGTEPVSAGANTDVRIPLRYSPHGDLVALLKIDGEVVAQQVIRR